MLGADYKYKKVFGYTNFGGDDLYSFFPAWVDIEGGRRLTWEKVELVVNISELPRNKTCLNNPKELRYIGFDIKKNFDDTVKFCRNIGGRIAVTRDQQRLEEISQVFSEKCQQGSDWFYSGYVDTEETERLSDVITGETMPWDNSIHSSITSECGS